ncbi:MAG: thioredoxin domain-containing protein [Planctomycetota bacterium]
MNQLADSLSPYLLQHQSNPVDWYPWCDEAFQVAQERDVPVFLSVGYAACHWCHVMERESFENESIAEFLNKRFVSIKVDREERPDIDQIYMNAVQVMTGRGGWPMSVFLDHDRQPFYAGTYWPPTARGDMPGFAQVLDAIADAWLQRRDEVCKHARHITDALQQLAVGTGDASSDLPEPHLVDQACDALLESLDTTHGGFGGTPKFPHATDLLLLLTRGQATGNQPWVNAATLTLRKMAAGGIRDHIGGGFARYSVDARWLVPHFEKMLYDNGLLAEVYLRAYQVTGEGGFADVATEVLDYLITQMTDSSGGFHCSEDADSEGVEGKYYVWTPNEVAEVLGDDSQRFCRIYNITPQGNFEGKSIPHLTRSIAQWAEDESIELADFKRWLGECRRKLFEARSRRVRPARDDKVIAGWNALAIRSLAIAGGVLERTDYLRAAREAVDFVGQHMRDDDGRLLHVFRGQQSRLPGYVDDHAYLIDALVALYENTGDSSLIDHAVKLGDQLVNHFFDAGSGGFFYTADDSEGLIARQKDWHDGSLISGNASAVMAMLKLSRLAGRDDFREAAIQTLRVAHEVLSTQAAACAGMLIALDRCHHDHEQWVLAVAERSDVVTWRQALLDTYRPHATLAWSMPDQSSHALSELIAGKNSVDGQAALYCCRHFVCEPPMIGETIGEILHT